MQNSVSKVFFVISVWLRTSYTKGYRLGFTLGLCFIPILWQQWNKFLNRMLQELYFTNSSSFLLKTGTNQGQLHYMNTTTSALISCDNACKLPATMEGIIIFGNDNIINMSLLGVVHFWRCWSKILLGRYSCCSQSKNYLLDVGRAPNAFYRTCQLMAAEGTGCFEWTGSVAPKLQPYDLKTEHS